MAAGPSDHKIGTMPVESQKGTFGGFMNTTVYGGCMLAVILLFPILVFCTALTWVPSLVLTAVFGIILGVALKLKGGWFAAVIGLCVFLAILSVLVSLFVGFVSTV